MAFSGVRSSWLTAARNRDLASLADSRIGGAALRLGAQLLLHRDIAQLGNDALKDAVAVVPRRQVHTQISELPVVARNGRALEPQVDGRLLLALAQLIQRLQEEMRSETCICSTKPLPTRIAHPGEVFALSRPPTVA